MNGRKTATLLLAAALAVGTAACGSEDRPGGGTTTEPDTSVPDTSPDVTLPDVTLPDVTLPDITLPGDDDATPTPAPTVGDTDAVDDDGLSPAAIVVVALIALAGTAWLFSTLGRHRRTRAESARVGELERRHRIDTLVRTSQWADGQMTQVLAADDPAALAPARTSLHQYLDAAQLDAAHLASDISEPELARATEALGVAIASARGALISYLDLGTAVPRPTDHDLGLARQRLEQRQAELRALTAQVQGLAAA